MKLNLLPKTVAKNVQSKLVFTVMLALVAANLVGAFLYSQSVHGEKEVLKREAEAKEPEARKVVEAARSADDFIAQAQIVITNSALYNAIQESNTKYPDLYDEFLPYLPSWFRLRSITARSAGPEQATVTLTGYLKSFQHYSDIMIALLRFPDAVAVGRSAYAPVPPGDEAPFAYSYESTDRGPIPGWSAVTFTVQLNRDLQAPDAKATLQGLGGAGAPGAPGAAPPPGGGSRPATAGAAGPGGRTGAPPSAPPRTGRRLPDMEDE